MNRKTTFLVPCIVLYIIAGLLAVYAIWAYAHCVDIVSQARAAGQLITKGNEYDIISFYMTNCGQYIVYALMLAAAGLVLQKWQTVPALPAVLTTPQRQKAYDNELDDWFNELDSENESTSEKE